MAGKHWVERREQDEQRTLRLESNSGRREHSCAVCRRTNHEAIRTDTCHFIQSQLANLLGRDFSLLGLLKKTVFPLKLTFHPDTRRRGCCVRIFAYLCLIA